MKQKFLLLICLTTAWVSAFAAQTNNPVADSYVRGGASSNSNFGTTTTLDVKTKTDDDSKRDGYLKFSLSGLGSVATARLRLNAKISSGPGTDLTVYQVSATNWVETSITWSNRPSLGTRIDGSNVTTSSAWYAYDVSSYVRSEQASGKTLVSFGLHATNSTPDGVVSVQSREASSNKPELVIVTNIPPTISITNPSSGTVVGALATFTIGASASDSDGTITNVSFYTNGVLLANDTTSPYSASWASVPPGSYTLTAVATDNLGLATTSSSISVTVTNHPPTVSLTSPVAGAIIAAPGTFTLTANASDSDGSVSRVDFYANGTLVATDSSTPFSQSWSSVASGTYSLLAVAVDNLGLMTTSSAVVVTVDLAGLVGAWTFNEGSGATSADVTGLGNTALLGASTNWTTGHNGGSAIRVRSSATDEIKIGNAGFSILPRTGGPFTVSLWMKLRQMQLDFNVLMFTDNGDESGGWACYFDPFSSPTNFLMYASAGTANFGTPLSLNTNWHKLDVTYDGGIINFYLDAVKFGTGYGGIRGLTNGLRFGNYFGTPGLDADIDDLKIYNRELGQHELGPIGKVQLVSVFKNGSTNIVLDGYVPSGKSISYAIAIGPTNGSINSLNGAAANYSPNSSYRGQDTFYYTVCDGTFTSAPVAVVVSVVVPHWLSTNGTGNGLTPSSPMLAYPSNALDAIISTNVAANGRDSYDVFYYAAGNYEMSSGVYERRRTIFNGSKHIGAGVDLTTLKLVNAVYMNGDGSIFSTYSVGEIDQDFEVSNMTLNCNAMGNLKYEPGRPVTLSVVFTNFGAGTTTAYSVTNVTIYWETNRSPYLFYSQAYNFGHAREYTVRARVGGVYTNIYSTTNGTGGVESISFPSVNADEIQLLMTRRGTNINFLSIGEFQIFSGGMNIATSFAGSGPSDTSVHTWDVNGQEDHYYNAAPFFGSDRTVDNKFDTGSDPLGWTNQWVCTGRDQIGAISIGHGNNIRLTNLKVVNFGSRDGRENFPISIINWKVGLPEFPAVGNVLVENVLLTSPDTHQEGNGGCTVLSVVGLEGAILSNAIVRNCTVADVGPPWTGTGQALSVQHAENCIVTNCGTGVYYEPGAPTYKANTLIRSNSFYNTPWGVALNFHSYNDIDTIVVKDNLFVASTNTGGYAFAMFSSDLTSSITNVVFLNNTVQYPNWTIPAASPAGGFFEFNFRNTVVGNNVMHLSNNNEIVVFFDPITNGNKRAMFNNVDHSGNLLPVLNLSRTPAAQGEWP